MSPTGAECVQTRRATYDVRRADPRAARVRSCVLARALAGTADAGDETYTVRRTLPYAAANTLHTVATRLAYTLPRCNNVFDKRFVVFLFVIVLFVGHL